jgi:hypothetical protein
MPYYVVHTARGAGPPVDGQHVTSNTIKPPGTLRASWRQSDSLERSRRWSMAKSRPVAVGTTSSQSITTCFAEPADGLGNLGKNR